MILTILFTALTLASVAFLAWPLLRRRTAKQQDEQHDMAVYREQLAEVDNDIERGLLTKPRAEAVRAEIYRRMLAVEDAELAAAGNRRKSGNKLRKITAAFIIIAVPITAAVLYLLLGSPQLPGQPFSERASGPEFALASSAEKMQAELEKKPSAKGYKQLAGLFSMMKRYADAVSAYQKAIKHGSNDAMTWSELGETVVLANDGGVVPEALDDFYKALKFDPKDARARFYIGLEEAQINNFRKAVGIWKGLQKESTPDAPWNDMVKEHIETYSKEGGFDPASVEPAMPPSLKQMGGMLSGQ